MGNSLLIMSTSPARAVRSWRKSRERLKRIQGSTVNGSGALPWENSRVIGRRQWLENGWIVKEPSGNIIRCDIYQLETGDLEVRVEDGTVGFVSSVAFGGIYAARRYCTSLRASLQAKGVVEELPDLQGRKAPPSRRPRR
jgi:hypothetical protein